MRTVAPKSERRRGSRPHGHRPEQGPRKRIAAPGDLCHQWRVASTGVAPAVVHVAPHPDDEAVGCPGALLHLKDRGWTVVSVIASLGFSGQRDRRRAESEEASRRAGFVPVFVDPPLDLDLDADLDLATRRIAHELPAIVKEHGASIVVSPSPHDVHHGHETVGRGVQRAMAVLPPTLRWWMWGVWGDLPAPNVFYGFDQTMLDRALHILDAYTGELARNDYRPYLAGRASANAVLGSERVFGFGSPAASDLPSRRCSPRCACSTGGSWAPSPTSSTRAGNSR